MPKFITIVTVVNWIVITLLAFVVIAETLNPTKGGDAAGKGMGQAIYYLAIIALITLLILNLLPYNWAKYTTLALILLPVVVINVSPIITQFKRRLNATPIGQNADGTPWFKYPAQQRLAIALARGEVDMVKQLLQEQPSLVTAPKDSPGMFHFAVQDAASSAFKTEEKLECVRLMLQMGAKVDNSLPPEEHPIHWPAAAAGNAALLKLLLEHGADPNAKDYYFKRPILLEAIDSYQNPLETVRVLLEHGAEVNVEYLDGDQLTRPLLYAAERERWSICRLLLEKGADPGWTSPNGTSLRTYLDAVNPYYNGDGYSSRADLDWVKAALK